MSALSFKINAETDKLKSFITMLERLRQVLAEIPDSTKEFDVINRKIGEMEARVEQTMRKIAQMEQQAMDAASKAAASATTGTAGGNSTAGTAATQAETAAYHDLLGELKAANDEKIKAIAQIRLYSNEIARLKADVTALNKEEQQNGQLSAKKRAQVLDAAVSIEEYKQEISQLRRELANQIKLEQTAIGSINEMSQALTRMRAVYKNLSAADREGAQGQTMLKNIESLDTKIKELDASMGVHTRNVGNYASGFNMLGFQIQQVARELPSLAYGPQIFFSAISNNLPMLADEIARAKKSVDELKKAGQTFTPVWKQIASSIFSWQTLLVAGVTVLTLYGKEITNWVASLFKGKEAALSLAQAQEKLNTTINEDGYAIGDQIAIIKELQIQWNKLGNNLSSKQQFIKDNSDRFKELDVAVNGVSDAENLLVKNTPNFIEALKLRAEAAAAQKLASESYEKALIEERKAQEQIAKGYHTEAFVGSPTTGGASFNAIDREYTEEEKAGLLAVANAARETADSYMNLKAAKELAARQLLGEAGIQEVGKEKAATEKDIRDLENAIQKLRDDALQAEIDSMKDGTAKKLAQIDLDYQKRARAIQEAEERIRELQKGELTKGQQAQIKALNQVNEKKRGEDWDAAFLSEAGIENPEEYLNKQLQAWNEYYMKYGTILEKIQATKSYYDKKISETEDAGAIAALKAEKSAALAALEVEGGTFVDDLVGKAEEYIDRIKKEIKAAIKVLEDEYNKLPSSDSEQGDNIRNQINILRAQLSALEKMDPVSDEEHSESFKKWQKLYSTLTKIEGQFKDIGEAAGGAMGEVISTASKITTSSLQMINSIKTLAESSAKGIEATGETAATTIQKVERASVILAIIQAALQIIQSIANLFGDTETSMERNIREAQELNEELRVMNERARLNADIFKTIFGEDAFGNYTNNIIALSDALNDYQATMDKITKRGIEKTVGGIGSNTGLANLYNYDFVWESVSESVANMMNQVRHSTWFRDAKYKKLKDVVPELFEESGVLNMQALKEFVEGNSDTFKHLSKENQTYLKELVNNWETYEEAVKAANDYLNGLFGDLGSTITDALVDSFEKGINAADAFGEAAGDMLKNLAKQVLYTATIAPAIEDAQKKIDEINRDAGLSDEQRFDALAGVVGDLLDDVMAQQQLGQELWDRLQQAAEERGIDWDEGAASQQATSRGFQTMSQDTGDELNGRFTDIQGKVTDIRGYVMAQTQSIIGLLTSMANIETAMYACVQVNNELLRYAVMTYMEIVEINGSTKNIDKTLVRIEEGINSIKKNTENI
jgi:DNA repair exonuclease SbcCD ATPase subunit|nr:MAG TPA: tail tape measure protein [Caudoviricetes sp.]